MGAAGARRRFLSRPSRGGMLTIVNCALWIVVALGAATGNDLLLLPALVACWPVAWVAFLPSFGSPSRSEVIAGCVVIGVNSLLWGYGISWLLGMGPRRRRPAPRGFEVIGSQAAGVSTATPPDAK